MSDGRRSGGRRPGPAGGGVLLVIGGLALLALGFVLGIVVLGQPPGGPDPGDTALGAGLSTAGGSTTAPRATTKPAQRVPIRFEPPRLNVGVLKPGQSVTGTVRIRNIGTTPLKILSSRPSCRCTSVDLANTVIEPGEAAMLTARYDAIAALGKKQETIRVLFEGYDQPAELAVLADVHLAVRAVPVFIAAIQATSGWFTVQSVDDRPFRILGSNGTAPVYDAFDPEVDGPRTSYKVKWDLTPFDATTCQDADGNPMPGWWVIETDHPECPIFDLTVRHMCTVPRPPPDGRPWVLSQTRASIGRLEPGESAEYRVSLKWLGDAEPDDTVYTALSESPEQFDAELVAVEQRGTLIEALIRVTPRDGYRGLIYGTVQIYTARHSAPLVVIGQVADAG